MSILLGVRWQYTAVPLTPTKNTAFSATPASTIAMFTSGAPLYNPISSTVTLSLASKFESASLDPCSGHSSPDSQYHYHAVRKSLSPSFAKTVKTEASKA